MIDALGPNQTFRTIDRKPIYWRDKQDFVHACEGAEVHRGVTLIWTLCERDVPANAAYKCDGDDVTCATCRARALTSHQGKSP
jgi:phenylpropionate dioxygenase-like ring-hydroxylating dioxygenase large terminal subunit